MGFGQGLSGLNAAAQNLDVIGNNIANSGTVGFKAGSATFADVYASSRVGLGVQVASVNQRFTTGTVSSTGNQFDMAIDGANGLFVVKDPSGATLYTRNGQFYADKNNNIVNAQGQQLQGYLETNGVLSTTLSPVTVPTANIKPQATSAITNTVNLDANAAVVPKDPVVGQVTLTNGGGTATYYYTVAGGNYTWTDSAGVPDPANPALTPDGSYTTGASADPVTITAGQPSASFPSDGGNVAYAPGVQFDMNDPTTFSNMTPVTVYDSLGNSHTVQQYYTKREPVGSTSVWEVNYVVDGVPPSPPANQATLTFDNDGRLVSGSPATISFTPGSTTSPAAAMSIKVAYDGSTQFGGSFGQNFIQDGYATGQYASMSVGTDGSLVANYTNGVTKVVGRLALANFNNLEGLQPVGGNAWAETANSGQPILGTPGSNGLALIKGQSVEESNVDMSQELVNMIIAQRTYQANAQTIKTQDQVLQTLINMS